MYKGYPKHPYQPLSGIRDLVYVNAKRWGNKDLYIYVENKQKLHYTYNRHKEVFDSLGTAFAELGLFDKTVSLVGDQHPQWVAAYLTTITAGGVIVPLDRAVSPDQLAGFVNSTESSALFISEKDLKAMVPYLSSLSTVKYIVVIGDEPKKEDLPKDERIRTFNELLALGDELLKSGDRRFLDYNRDPSKLAAILFTSGTTGTSKGVMLTENNIVASIVICCRMVASYEKDSFVAVLPINHTFAMTTNHMSMANIGGTVFMNDSIKYALRNFAEVKPTTLILVPLFLETMDKKIWDGIRKKGKEKQVRSLMKFSNGLRKLGIDLRRTFFKEILDVFGGNLKYIIVGGAPLNPEYIRDFDAFGVTVAEGYGITECCPLISVNPYNWCKIGSVGLLACDMQVKIDAKPGESDGEILVKGPNVFIGYFKNEEATKSAFTSDGWFRTGDIGHVDADNFIYLTGRKKNVIIASNGKNVYPEELEEYLYKIPYIKEVVVIGRQKAGETAVTAVVFPDHDAYPDMTDAQFYDTIKAEINTINKALPAFKHITELDIRDTEFEKTTTRKIKRFLIK